MKRLRWELRTLTLEYQDWDLNSNLNRITAILFKRKCRITTVTRWGADAISFRYAVGLPLTWDEVSRLHFAFVDFLEHGPSLWKAAPHPKGICLTLKDRLFKLSLSSVKAHPNVRIRAKFRTIIPEIPAVGSLEVYTDDPHGPSSSFRLASFSLPSLLVVKGLRDAGYRLIGHIPSRGYEEIDNFQSLSESSGIWVYGTSELMGKVESVPLTRLDKKAVRGLKYLERLTDGTVQI